MDLQSEGRIVMMSRKNSVWREDEKERFINPYNFIPFEKDVLRKNVEIQYKDTYTGYFKCRFQLLTPLIIPNTSNNQTIPLENDPPDGVSYDFFSYENLSHREITKDQMYMPVIPGSEIRGAVRSVHEAAFCGCMSAVSANRILGRRYQVPKQPGILQYESGQWKLYPCKKAMLNVDMEDSKSKNQDESHFGKKIPRYDYNNWEEGQQIIVKLGDVFNKTRTKVVADYRDVKHNEKPMLGWELGYLHKGEAFPRKHHESIFIKTGAEAISVKDVDIESLKKVIEEYQKKKLKKQEIKPYAEYQVNENAPVLVYYYRNENDMSLYFSPACIGKEVFTNRVDSLLERSGGFQPCDDNTNVCPACSVFGMVSGKKGKSAALSSRIRFSDVHVCQSLSNESAETFYLPPIVLPELGEPKPGTVEFYTYQPDCLKSRKTASSKGYWTYDYYINDKNIRKKLNEYLPRLRGRKYYWHSEVLDNGNQKLGTMNQRVRPLKKTKDSIFEGKVFFENLTKEELMQVKWALDFNDKTCAHKIGRAKPLGFGSMRITVESIKIRDIDMNTGGWALNDMDINSLMSGSSVKGNAVEALKIMANWEARPEKSQSQTPNSNVRVSYPMGCDGKTGKNSNASHQWFNGNRNRTVDSSSMNPAFAKLLPEAKEEIENDKNKWLYRLVK